MAREIKDELQSEKPVTEEQSTPLSPIQIPLDEPMQDIIVDVIMDDYDKAKEDRNSMNFGTTAKGEQLDFEKWMEKINWLYSGYREAKTTPWKFCSNRSLRIATAILEMLHSRLFSAVWNEDLTRWRPGEVTDTPKIERISKFMDWWIKVWAPMRDFLDNWVKYTAAMGDSLVETSWDVEELPSGEFDEFPITDEAGLPLSNPDGTPSVSRIRKPPKRIEKTCSRLIPKESYYLMKNSKDIQRDPVVIEEEILYKDLLAMEKDGKAINVTEKLSKLIVVKMPEGIGDPIKEEAIKQVRMRNIPIKVLRWYGHYDVDGNGVNESVRLIASREFQIYLGGVRMIDVTKSGRRPLELAKYGSYLDKMESLVGEGVLDQVRELAEEVDACFNQMTDGNTLNILKPGFYDPSGDLDAPAIKLAPNIMIPVTDPQHNVYFPPFDINTDRLINAIRLVLEFIERLTAASSYIMGRESEIVGGSGTATRTQAIVQSAEIRFTRPAERLKASVSRILTQVLDMVQLNIPPGMETRVLGEKGEQLFHAGELTAEGLAGQFDAYLISDPTQGSKQTEREVAAMLYSLLLQNIIVGTDPVKIYKITADLLKSVGKDPQEYLGPEPNMDDIDDPEDENTLMVQGDFGRVRANMSENHILHIQKHMELMQSPSMSLLAQTAPALAQQIMEYNNYHIEEHTQMMQTMISLMSSIGGGKGGGSTKPGAAGGSGKGSPNDDPNKGVENTAGPLGQALATQRNGSSQPPT